MSNAIGSGFVPHPLALITGIEIEVQSTLKKITMAIDETTNKLRELLTNMSLANWQQTKLSPFSKEKTYEQSFISPVFHEVEHLETQMAT